MGSCGWFPLKHEQVRAWVDAHRDTLPTTVAELSKLPMQFRVAIVNSVSVEQRTAFWKEHLESFLTSDAALSDEQRAFVTEAIGELPAMFGGTRAEFESRTRALEGRMKTLLSREQAARMFGMVGPPEPPEGLPLPPDAVPNA